jgi:signal transduction histidine kinase/PAS domain-containing protein
MDEIKRNFEFLRKIRPIRSTGCAIISVPDLILLKADENYINYYNKPLNMPENSIGKKLKELIPEYNFIQIEENLNKVLLTGEPFYGEDLAYDCSGVGTTYWTTSIVPVFIEGKIKYLLESSIEVTDKVIKYKNKEQKNKEYEAIFENMSDALFVVDKDKKYIKLNNEARKFSNDSSMLKKVGDTLGYTKYCYADGTEIPTDELPLFKVYKGETVKNYRISCIRPDGMHHYLASGSPIYDDEGNVDKAVVLFSDVTELENNKEILRNKNEEFEAIIENISDGLIFFDREGNFKKINKAAKDTQLLDFERMDKFSDFFNQVNVYDSNGNCLRFEDLPASRVLRRESFYKIRVTQENKKGRRYCEMSGTPIFDRCGNLVSGVLIINDIGERLKSEENMLLKAQYESVEKIIRNLQFGFLRLSFPDMKIIDMNRKFYDYLKKIHDKFPAFDSVIGIAADCAEMEKYICKFKNTMYCNSVFSRIKKFTSNGEDKYYKIIYQPLYGLSNRINEVIIISVDLTEEYAAKEKIAETLKTEEEFFVNITHELKTPINVIFSANQLLDVYLESSDLELHRNTIKRDNDIIKQNCYRLTKLVNNIVDLSKIESGLLNFDVKNENIVEVVEDIVQSIVQYVRDKELNIVFDTDVEEKIIAVDSYKIERVLLNLISNAVKFSEKGSEINVIVHDKGNSLEICVTDHGIGIDNEQMEIIFERFRQIDKTLSRNAEGSGVGLSLVKSIVEKLGGSISVKSEVGKGSTFTVSLPVYTVDEDESIAETKLISSKLDMINIEFSDIYSI